MTTFQELQIWLHVQNQQAERWFHSTESKNKITISLDVQSWVYGWWWEGSGGWKVEREGFSVVFLDVLT